MGGHVAQRYVLLPHRGVKASDHASARMLSGIFDVASRVGLGNWTTFAAVNRAMSMLDSTNENGPKLVELDRESADAINRSGSPIRAFPEVFYTLPRESTYAILKT